MLDCVELFFQVRLLASKHPTVPIIGIKRLSSFCLLDVSTIWWKITSLFKNRLY